MAASVPLNYSSPSGVSLQPRKRERHHQNSCDPWTNLVKPNGTTPNLRRGQAPTSRRSRIEPVRCSGGGISIGDFIGGDLLKPDLGHWLSDVEEHKALAIYSPHEGGYEGCYFTRLRYQGYYFLNLTARGLR